MEMITVKKFIECIDNGEAQVLTVEKAKALKGKRIYWMYFGYEGNENSVNEMTVGDIVTQYEYNKSQPMKGYPSRTAYWESYMTNEKLQDIKDILVLLDVDGTNNYIYASTGRNNFFDEPTFTCSDADRSVFFMICE